VITLSFFLDALNPSGLFVSMFRISYFCIDSIMQIGTLYKIQNIHFVTCYKKYFFCQAMFDRLNRAGLQSKLDYYYFGTVWLYIYWPNTESHTRSCGTLVYVGIKTV
jgi:hypothetical protein